MLAAAALLMLAVALFGDGTQMFATAPAYTSPEIYTPPYSEVPPALVYSGVPAQYEWLADDTTYIAPPSLSAPEESSFGWPEVAMLAMVGAVVRVAALGRTAVAEADVESAKTAARIATLGVQGRENASFSRRDALLGAASLPFLGLAPSPARADGYEVPPLTYNYSALEPYIDTDTMMLHHDAHHLAYVTKLNAQTEGKPAASLLSLQADAKAAGLNNSAGGHYNHSMFWTTMGADCGGAPTGELGAAIDKAFGSYDKFKEAWAAAAAGVFGSGWAWLVVGKGGDVAIKTTPNQDNPLMDKDGDIPILGIDVWEHAYYLRYKNKRPEYIKAFFAVINWPKVAEYYASAKSGKAIDF
jgi:Fe-Mn family superoxide dismutase